MRNGGFAYLSAHTTHISLTLSLRITVHSERPKTSRRDRPTDPLSFRVETYCAIEGRPRCTAREGAPLCGDSAAACQGGRDGPDCLVQYFEKDRWRGAILLRCEPKPAGTSFEVRPDPDWLPEARERVRFVASSPSVDAQNSHTYCRIASWIPLARPVSRVVKPSSPTD
jgi:hypothetical protein